jgi:hypothetical protein
MSKYLNDTLVKLEKLMTYNNQGRNMIEAEEKLKKELQIELEQMFPIVQDNMDNKLFLEMQQEMVRFVISIQQDEFFSYMENRDKNKCVYHHFAEFPLGVAFIEKWRHTNAFEFSQNILSIIKSSMTDDSSYTLIAELFDSKDLDNFIRQSNFSESDEKKVIEMLTPVIDAPQSDLLLQAMSSTYSGANNIPQSLLKFWSQTLNIGGHDIQEIIARAKEIEIENKKGTKDSLKSNDLKHAKIRKIKDFAIKLYLERAYPSVKNCSENIAEEVMEYALKPEIKKLPGKDKTFKISTLPRTIERWIGEYKKKQKTLGNE